jgi:hypothetical protein
MKINGSAVADGAAADGAATTATATAATATATATATETKISKQCFLECILFGLSWTIYCTIQYQCAIVSKLILITMFIYGISYGLLRHFANHQLSLQPKLSSWVVVTSTTDTDADADTDTGTEATTFTDNNTVAANAEAANAAAKKQKNRQKQKLKKQKQNAALASEWRSRLLAIINAIILIYGCIYCFMEWSSYIPESEGWVVLTDSLDSLDSLDPAEANSFNNLRSNNPVIFYASLFLGYLQWDIIWLIYHRKDSQSTHEIVGTFIHHIIFISISQFVLCGTYFRKPFAWLSLTELSTPFLHIRWLLAATGNKDNYNNLYYYISLLFAITFILTRVIGYGLGLIDIWITGYKYWYNIYGLKYGVIIGLHIGYILNLFWSIKVISALIRAITTKSENSKKSKNSNSKISTNNSKKSN